jgi:arylformamidase
MGWMPGSLVLKDSARKIIDISVPVSPGMPVWPGDSPVSLERRRDIAAGDASTDSHIACGVHVGTHVDAPAHFIPDGKTVAELPLEVLIGPAVVVEVQDADGISPDYLARLILPPETRRLLFKTANSALWDDPHHAFRPDFVALEAAAARWIVERNIALVGIDYLSIQLFRDAEPWTHKILLDAGVVVVEGLDLRNVEPGTYQLVCLPLKLAGSEGAPARAVLIG